MSEYIELEGRYNTAKVFTYNIDNMTQSQVIELCNQEAFSDSKIRIMPDTHAGKGCVIGTTMTLTDKIVPNLVGVDIGCGMAVSIFNKRDIGDVEFQWLDDVIRESVPSGFSVHNKVQDLRDEISLSEMAMFKDLNNTPRIDRAIGTLGGGNHFIELNDDGDFLYLVVHSGSRNLGKQVAEHYQDLAISQLEDSDSRNLEVWISKMKSEGKEHIIQSEISKHKKSKVNPALAYLTGDAYWDYLHDMNIAQQYAWLNREQMLVNIQTSMGWNPVDEFQTIHNYINTEEMILRKGAISAKDGERVIIPLNMRDGSIIAYGKGDSDWNFSAPHGAGRVLSRGKAKRELSMDEFESEMSGVWSSSVKESTLDESPMAYKPASEIIDAIGESVNIQSIIKPLYNFKAS